MIAVGITGQTGFIGNHLYQTIKLLPNEFILVEYDRGIFDDEDAMDSFTMQCDVIIHLAAVNRHDDAEILFKTNIDLAKKLVSSLERTGNTPHIIFSSSTQEERSNNYGNAKKIARNILANWASKADALFHGLIIPNVFGPFGKPFYNSVIATFSYQLCNNEIPRIEVNASLNLIYVGQLVQKVIEIIKKPEVGLEELIVSSSRQAKVSEILQLMITFKDQYILSGIIPELKDDFEIQLFNTFRSYIDCTKQFPIKYKLYPDKRGTFAEIVRLMIGGQVSFSTTVVGAIRGNHFHTRKIERFSVIKGKALIQLRKVGSDKVVNLYLDGEQPSYVDMPIWYTHNIKNIGNDELITLFWINEIYNPDDSDTFFLAV